MNPELFEDSDEEDGADDMIVKQAEGARVGGRMLCALSRCVQGRERHRALWGGGGRIMVSNDIINQINPSVMKQPDQPDQPIKPLIFQ